MVKGSKVSQDVCLCLLANAQYCATQSYSWKRAALSIYIIGHVCGFDADIVQGNAARAKWISDNGHRVLLIALPPFRCSSSFFFYILEGEKKMLFNSDANAHVTCRSPPTQV